MSARVSLCRSRSHPVHLIYEFSRYSYNVTVIIIITEQKKMVHYLKGVDKKDIGLCTEQIIASISLAY